ncbi:MAG: hypothetical protein KF895_00970 [Parvibaculum sp.]|nr:hypothetical protein [Parvibaculum sp.]
MKKFLSAVCLALAVAFAPAMMMTATPAAAQTAQELEQAVEQLVIDNAQDPDALAAAIEAFVLAAADAELATDAVIAVLTNPKNDEVRLLLESNPGLKTAAGIGLGAAIAQIGITNPELAATLLAKVEASGDTTLTAAVTDGYNERTASIQLQQQREDDPLQQDTTPETPLSDN